MKKNLLSVAAKALPVALLATFAASASAQKAGDTVLNVGAFYINTMDSSQPVSVTSPTQTVLEGSGSKVNDASTLGIALTQYLTDNISLTLDGGIPPTFTLDGTGTLESVGKIGQAKQWTPALVAKYHFGDSATKFRPFVGAGIAYTWYSDIEVTDTFQKAISQKLSGGATTAGKSNIDLESSFSALLNVGATYAINDRWSLTGSVSYLFLKTKANIETTIPTVGVVKSHTELSIDPLVAFLAVGYKF
jgi:outer membrane protein